MRSRSSCQCGGEAHEPEFDAREAFQQLSLKYEQLAQLVIRHLQDPTTDPGARLINAGSIADDLVTIVGGVVVGPNDFPECCLIGRRTTNQQQFFCTGVLVHPRVVLTAAHCFTPQAAPNVVALKTNNQNNLANANVVSVRRMVIHPAYPSARTNDIGVIILRNDAAITPVAIATPADMAASATTTLVGFGNNDFQSTRGFGIKRQVNVPITHLRRTAGDNLNQAEEEFGFESDNEFVAGGGGRDSCHGDSGGPAYVNAGGQRKVGGLTSRGAENADRPCGDAGIYTRVDANIAFVKSTAQQFGISIP